MSWCNGGRVAVLLLPYSSAAQTRSTPFELGGG